MDFALDFAHLETGQYKKSPNAWKLTSKTAPWDPIAAKRREGKKTKKQKTIPQINSCPLGCFFPTTQSPFQCSTEKSWAQDTPLFHTGCDCKVPAPAPFPHDLPNLLIIDDEASPSLAPQLEPGNTNNIISNNCTQNTTHFFNNYPTYKTFKPHGWCFCTAPAPGATTNSACSPPVSPTSLLRTTMQPSLAAWPKCSIATHHPLTPLPQPTCHSGTEVSDSHRPAYSQRQLTYDGQQLSMMNENIFSKTRSWSSSHRVGGRPGRLRGCTWIFFIEIARLQSWTRNWPMIRFAFVSTLPLNIHAPERRQSRIQRIQKLTVWWTESWIQPFQHLLGPELLFGPWNQCQLQQQQSKGNNFRLSCRPMTALQGA